MGIYHRNTTAFSSVLFQVFVVVFLALNKLTLSSEGEICAGRDIIMNCTNRLISTSGTFASSGIFQCDVCCQLGSCCQRNGSVNLQVIHRPRNISKLNYIGWIPQFCRYILTTSADGRYFNSSQESIIMIVAGFNGSNNRLTTFPCFSQWPKIKWIDLSKNDIHKITSPLFFGNGSMLTTLILKDNGLRVTHEHMFKNLRHLRNIYLSENPIEDYSFISNLNDYCLLDLRNRNVSSYSCNHFCEFCANNVTIIVYTTTSCGDDLLCVETDCFMKSSWPVKYSTPPLLNDCEDKNVTKHTAISPCDSFSAFGVSFLSSGHACIWVPLLFLITVVGAISSFIMLVRWRKRAKRQVFQLADTTMANVENELVEWSPDALATPPVRRMSMNSQIGVCFPEDHSTRFRDSLLILNHQDGQDRRAMSIVFAKQSFESTFQPGFTLTTSFRWNEGLQHRRMMALPMTPDELRISDYYSEEHTTSDEIYSSVKNSYYASKGKIYFEDAICLVVQMSSGLLHNRWIGVIAAQNQPNKCAVFTTVTNAMQEENAIHWDLFVERTLELPVSKSLLRIEGTCIYKGKHYLIHEHLIGKTLYSRIASNQVVSFDTTFEDPFVPAVTSDVIRYVEGILSAMNLIHSYGFYHPGLSTKKVLLTKQGICKLYDFCLPEDASNIVAAKKSQINPSVNNFAPEALLTNEYTKPSDVWSTAVVIWEILSGGLAPFSTSDEMTNEYDITITLPKRWPEKFRHLRNDALFDCWNKDCSYRPTIQQLGSSFSQVFSRSDDDSNLETGSLSREYLFLD